ncbi:MAG: hypothetical protein KIH63_005905 [Candidatus Saccharibacteria bacterium]|nr:hypothetical protein [Candidatus Saccharibacteria bacterium]
MTTDNLGFDGIDSFLERFTPMEQVDVTPRPDLIPKGLEIEGIVFKRGGNGLDVIRRDERVSRSLRLSGYDGNTLAIRKELVDRGIMGTTEDNGPARGKEGQIVEGNVTYFTHPGIRSGLMLDGEIDGEVLRHLGGTHHGHAPAQIMSTFEYDATSVRAAVDAVLERPEFARAAAIAAEHHERVFGDHRLGGWNSQTVGEYGGVPDPADGRYLDYINGQF